MKGLLLPLLSWIALTVNASTVVENATYDDLPQSVTNAVIGTYKNLVYNAIEVNGVSTSIITVGGVASASPPRRAVTSSQQQLENGTASVAVASPYKSLSLLDFFFGCAVHTDEGAAAVANQCTITVAGFKRGNNQEVALASYTFTPPVKPVTPVPMLHAVLPKTFQQPLFNITIAQANPLLAVLIDNLHYSVST